MKQHLSHRYYARSLPGRPQEEWQRLEDHLKNVAEMAKGFAEEFGAGEWGYLAGLWHDLGKYSQEFQTRLQALSDPDAHIEAKPGRPDHSTAGAQHVYSILKDKGKMIAYAIAGHHAGLPDGKTPDQSCLVQRFKKAVPDYSASPNSILNQKTSIKLPFSIDQKRFSFQFAFFVRMLFSCLTDADFLDTERFIKAEKSSWRDGYPELKLLEKILLKHMEEVVAHVPASVINGQRAEIYRHCLNAADSKPGLFSLTVPTGGGKTLSSLSFALKHAVINDLKRVIYVIPYTSIIEQNADVFRQVIGEDAVLEHHSNYDPPEEDHRSRLASENWDAPLVVTTNVQFFESLFGSRSSRCRRLHNIAQSVVILDEAQMLPAPLLKPCLEAMKELVLSYGSTIVLCTATQPALLESIEFKDGLQNVREIIPDPGKLYDMFKKVDVSSLGTLTNKELGRQLTGHEQVLCIVNTRRHARQVYEQICENGCYHLSALMCPAHRTETINEIKKALKDKRPCRVISTQLIEAGVDIDFPVVFRSLSGIDSIVQAAGRCNREGKLLQNGQVYVFMPEDGLPPGYFRQTAETAEEVMRHHNNPIALEAVEEYFRTLYWLKNEKLDEYGILADLSEGSIHGDFPFRRISEKFKMIKEIGQESLIIPWNEDAQKIINELRYGDYPASAARKAQRFTIQIPARILYNLLGGGAIERLQEQYNVLTNRDIYRMDLGLCPEDPLFHEIENLIL